MSILFFPSFVRHSPQIPQTIPAPSGTKHLHAAWIYDVQLCFSLG